MMSLPNSGPTHAYYIWKEVQAVVGFPEKIPMKMPNYLNVDQGDVKSPTTVGLLGLLLKCLGLCPKHPDGKNSEVPGDLVWIRAVLNAKKKKHRPEPGNFKRARGHSMCSTMVVALCGRRLAAVGGWQLATGGWWRLVVFGGGWWLAVGGWRQLAVVGSWRLVAAGGWRRLVAGGWWRLVAVGS